MPPRVPIPATAAAPSLIRTSANATCCLAQTKPSQVSVAAKFSTTASSSFRIKYTKARRQFFEWLDNEGQQYRYHNKPGPNYLSRFGEDANVSRPFRHNKHFISTRVLSEESRELIWRKVMRQGETIKAVSAEYGIDIRRVAAVVRLKEVEKDWLAKGKRLVAKPYAKAVLNMLPMWRLNEETSGTPFEPINELHVHPYTMQQIFWPTSESRHFTREDAAAAFHPKLLSADKRIPHPELVQMEKDILNGRPVWDASERFKQAAMESERAAAEKQAAKAELEEKMTARVDTGRFEFRFKQYNSDNVGPKGKSRSAVGWRYGAPLDDRAKGHQIKIPTSVP